MTVTSSAYSTAQGHPGSLRQVEVEPVEEGLESLLELGAAVVHRQGGSKAKDGGVARQVEAVVTGRHRGVPFVQR